MSSLLCIGIYVRCRNAPAGRCNLFDFSSILIRIKRSKKKERNNKWGDSGTTIATEGNINIVIIIMYTVYIRITVLANRRILLFRIAIRCFWCTCVSPLILNRMMLAPPNRLHEITRIHVNTNRIKIPMRFPCQT